MMKQSYQHLHNGILLVLMAYFREATNGIISFEPVCIYVDLAYVRAYFKL